LPRRSACSFLAEWVRGSKFEGKPFSPNLFISSNIFFHPLSRIFDHSNFIEIFFTHFSELKAFVRRDDDEDEEFTPILQQTALENGTYNFRIDGNNLINPCSYANSTSPVRQMPTRVAARFLPAAWFLTVRISV
jgi:hypothetical protein